MAQNPLPLRLHNPIRAGLLAWLVPGLGHFYQGRTGKGWLYLICILSLYFVGFVLGEGKVVYWNWVNPWNNPDQFSLHYLGQFWVGLPALPALIQGTLRHYGMNTILWDFMALADPTAPEMRGIHPRLGKLVEVGTIYTTIAGLLNVLAIYDAYEGPAYSDSDADEETAPADTASSSVKDLSNLKAETPV
jgi:hypothetical protein